jgi:hypothetical protein
MNIINIKHKDGGDPPNHKGLTPGNIDMFPPPDIWGGLPETKSIREDDKRVISSKRRKRRAKELKQKIASEKVIFPQMGKSTFLTSIRRELILDRHWHTAKIRRRQKELYSFKSVLLDPRNRSILQQLLVGTVIRTEQYPTVAEGYIRTHPKGYLLVVSRPSFTATKRLMQMILHCPSSLLLNSEMKIVKSLMGIVN